MKRRSGTIVPVALPTPARVALAMLSGLLLAALLLPPSARAETINALRIRLNPNIAAPGTLPPQVQRRLEALAATTLTLTGTTRTGGLELALAEPRDAAELKTALRALREDRSVLWAEPAISRGAAQTA